MNRKKIALGCMRIGGLSVEKAEELILCALEHGVTLFDHADIYGNRKCEDLFGQVLERNPRLREKIVIQSKCGICGGYYDLSKEHIIKQVEESIRLLKCGYLDILLLHRPDALVDYQEVNEAFKYLLDHTTVVHTYDELKDVVENKGGYAKMMWCGEEECENRIKADTSATSRCMPFDQTPFDDVCPICGKKAKKVVLFAKAY